MRGKMKTAKDENWFLALYQKGRYNGNRKDRGKGFERDANPWYVFYVYFIY
jgi:hypothetical protein